MPAVLHFPIFVIFSIIFYHSNKELMPSSVLLKKTLESSLDSKRSNQSILKETKPEYSLDRGAWWVSVPGVAELDTTEQLAPNTGVPL